MRARLFLRCLSLLVLCAVLAGWTGAYTDVRATETADTEDLEQQKKDTEDKIDSIKSSIDTVEDKIQDLEDSKSDLQTYITQLDGQVNSLSAQIQDLEDQIESKEEEIQVKTAELEEAEAEAADQYEMMKLRIRYTYEQGNQSFLVLLLESKSLADMMNRAEYAMQMTEYDRQMMEKLKETQAQIEDQKEDLEQEKTEQEEMLDEVEAQKSAVNSAIDAKTQEIASYQSQIQTASGEQSVPLPARMTATAELPVSCGPALPVIGSPVRLAPEPLR